MSAKAAISPLVTLGNGKTMPILGLGTWKSKPGEVEAAVKSAILDAGIRHIDCAFVYQNEDEVGNAIEAVLKSGAVKREELFVTSKIWNTFHSTDLVVECLNLSLAKLKLDYLDLLLIHWPFGYKEGGPIFPQDDKGNSILSDVDYLDTWKGLEKAQQAGLTKSIGVSNFNSEQIKRVIANATIKPVVNQFECHPYLNQSELIALCKENGIQVVGYSPLGSPDRPWAKPGDVNLLEEPVVVEIAKRLAKSPAQVLIRFQIQRGVAVIPKSVTPSRILTNTDVFDFVLSDEDVKALNALNRGHRFVALAHVSHAKYFPFAIPY